VSLQKVAARFKQRADFIWIYIREAHPTDGRRPAKHVEVEQPKTFEARFDVAQRCSGAIDLGMPQLVDDMKDSCAKAYNAMPDRLFILGADGRIAYRGARGPRGFKVDEMEQALTKLLAEKQLK